MDLICEAGLHGGTYNGFDYVYGIPIYGGLDEIVEALPNGIAEKTQIHSYTNKDIGRVYVATDRNMDDIPNDVLSHVKEEFYKKCFNWYEFENAGTFIQYYMSGACIGDGVCLYMDKAKNKYYARRCMLNAINLLDFANVLDTLDAIDLEHNSTFLTKVEYKKEESKK